jgi:hypothetical protein
MILWSYKLEPFDLMTNGDYTTLEASLNKQGGEGWELVGVQDVGQHPFAIYKRPVDIGEPDD